MDTLLQLLFSGLAIGSIYGLIALGLTLMFKSIDLINFTQGEMVMVGAFLGVLFSKYLNIPFIIVFPLTLLVGALIGVVLSRLIYFPLKKQSLMQMMIASLSISIIMSNIARIIGGPKPIAMEAPISGVIMMGNVRISIWSTVIILTSVVIMILLAVFFKTRAGIALKATMDDKEAAQLMGINLDYSFIYTFVLSASLGGAAGLLIAPITYVSFTMGTIILKAFAASALGGFYSIPGAIVGGMLIGLLETFGGGYITSAYRETLIFSVLILTLIFMPRGLLGGREQRKA